MNGENYPETETVDFLKKISVNSIGLTDKAAKALVASGIKTVYDLCETNYLKFRGGIPGLGDSRQREVLDRMEQFGLKFKWEANSPFDKLFSDRWKQQYNTNYEEVDVSRIMDVLMRIERDKYYSD